jgi:hypothetical protein
MHSLFRPPPPSYFKGSVLNHGAEIAFYTNLSESLFLYICKRSLAMTRIHDSLVGGVHFFSSNFVFGGNDPHLPPISLIVPKNTFFLTIEK